MQQSRLLEPEMQEEDFFFFQTACRECVRSMRSKGPKEKGPKNKKQSGGVYRIVDVVGVSKTSWEDAGKRAVETAQAPDVTPGPAVTAAPAGTGPGVSLSAGDSATWTIPLQITVRLGGDAQAAAVSASAPTAAA